jgi:hypothetical protein
LSTTPFSLKQILTLPGETRQRCKYDLMPNVRRVIHIPPWGTEELVEVPFSRIYLRKQEITYQVIEEEFVTLYHFVIPAA